MSENKTQNSKKVSSTLARSDDGTIQITFTIPYSEIKETQDKVVDELKKDIEIPGFRKGNAPKEKVAERIPQNTLLERTLSKILPKLVGDAIKEHKITPVIYPKFELIKAVPDEDWQIRAVTCELPKIDLGDYKKEISGKARADKLWVPGKDDKKKEASREEKEQEIINILLDSVKVTIPKVLIEEEVNSRLAKLLERLEKLGLSLDSYLSSIGKTAVVLRQEYEKASNDALAIDLILSEIALQENLSADPKEVDAAVNAAKADPKLAEELDTPERRRFIEVILKRRKALNSLISLVG